MTTTKFTQEMALQLSDKLKQLPPLPPEKIQLNKQQLIEQMADGIKAAQAQGYTLAQIAQILSDEDADISLSALKRYLPKSPKLTKRKQPTKTTQKTALPAADIHIIEPEKPSSFVPFKEPQTY